MKQQVEKWIQEAVTKLQAAGTLPEVPAAIQVEETKDKLAFDLYYLKNRSVALDIKIALKTIKTLLSRTGL